MTTTIDTSPGARRQHWLDVLDGAGLTTAPRWCATPGSGIGEHVEPVPGDLAATLATPGALVAAHAVVLAALSGEREITTGYLPAADAEPLPLRLTVGSGAGRATWQELVDAAAEAAERSAMYADFPVDALAVQLGRSGPLFEIELDPFGSAGGPSGFSVLRVTITDGALVVRHRADLIDAEAAARIAGYHVTALAQLAADPTGHPASLLSAAERELQLVGFAGPVRGLPDERFHELFEKRVAAHPDAIAAVHAGRRLTYGELNARANRLARALLARGLRREGVVAVVAERNLDWMTAVLAIFKAGGVYLPIEPHFPADRIGRTLSRAGCELALTEPGSDTTLRTALTDLPQTRPVLFAEAYAEPHADDDLGIRVDADQLAYIYFTSGSTGEPKGAMCEHAGMLNHLLAKVEDFGIAEGAVVAQSAPQCFDISLWQLVSALLVGGRTVIVPQEVILDVERFVAEITANRVAVLQLVPSYLEVVATYLEQHPAALPDLRTVSATGEALKHELIQRWFAVAPQVPLVNAYGLTETSDDTNHEVMRQVPEGGKVPLGRAVRNVRVYVLDEDLQPVPLGAPGLIAFSGVCVGRGYVNDPERTRQCYLTDPHRPGERLYLGGDYGRWLPGGKLEFLGRRDNQVKIRGFRIEIGEIDNALLEVPGVRDGAVVVAERADGSKHLVAYYTADAPIAPEIVAVRLGARLPEYMVPAQLHQIDRMPLTPNGKIDTKALRAMAAAEAGQDAGTSVPPATPTEEMLAEAFAKVLDIPVERIGRTDHFYEIGGTSLTAVKLAIATRRVVTLKEIAATPVLADLAALVDSRTA
ncbi:amino acid adenylation domain-containing protein [Pseudonocardia thermophila]|uniref:amino acid adenylation domain-containing protein n=1 Tax=Pseudonocardia thermophila TaxID=1848 RepID=UPI00248E8540|nr:amino acid adenylation domain-containing protein [Pseudonocardia thermophila]